MIRGIAYRRHQEEKKKKQARWVMKYMWMIPEEEITPVSVGINASTHCKPCSCMHCMNPRRNKIFNIKDRISIQERRAFQQEE